MPRLDEDVDCSDISVDDWVLALVETSLRQMDLAKNVFMLLYRYQFILVPMLEVSS